MSTLLTAEPKTRTRKIPAEISPSELHRWLTEGKDIQLLDVREPHEFAAGHLPDARLLPLGQAAAHAHDIDPTLLTVVYCKGGVRSAKAIIALREAGFTGALVNLKDGIVGWIKDVGSELSKP